MQATTSVSARIMRSASISSEKANALCKVQENGPFCHDSRAAPIERGAKEKVELE
jgi:hypothetical protein